MADGRVGGREGWRRGGLADGRVGGGEGWRRGGLADALPDQPPVISV